MKRLLAGLAVIGLLMVGTIPAITLAAGECPAGYATKDESGEDDNDLVIEAGTLICVKASTENTGIIVADGVTTLREYLDEAGIDHDVSHWVTYDPEPTPSPTPVEPTPTPVVTPSPTPVVTPSPTPTPTQGVLFAVPAFAIECGGTLTVTNFEAANVDAAVVDPVGLVILEDGVYPLEPGDYRIYGVLDNEVVTDEVEFTIEACPTEPTPTPVPTPTPPAPTLPPTDTE